MFIARPIERFKLGERNIVACQIVVGNPLEHKGKKLSLWCSGQPARQIRIEGVSTATDETNGFIDLQYSGDEIKSCDLEANTFITDQPMNVVQSVCSESNNALEAG